MASDEIEDLVARADAIRLPITEWARKANTTPQTVSRFNGRGSGRTSTLTRLRLALVAEEQRLLAHLQRLHGSAA